MVDFGLADHFRNIGGSTTRASYKPMKDITCHLQEIEHGWEGKNHSSQPPKLHPIDNKSIQYVTILEIFEFFY